MRSRGRTTRSVRPSGLNAQIEEKFGLSATMDKEVVSPSKEEESVPCCDKGCLLDANERPQDQVRHPSLRVAPDGVTTMGVVQSV